MAPKKKAKARSPAQTDSSPNKPLRVCHSNAKLRYGLTDKDLLPLKYELADNPHYASAAPMKLYMIVEVERVAKKKQERLAYEEEHAEEIAAEKAQAAKERRAAAAEAAKEAVQSFAGKAKASRHGGVVLPDVVLAHIMSCLADSLEPGGLRGPDRVTRDLAAAATVSWDFYHAAKTGFRALADAIGARLQQTKQRVVYSRQLFVPKAKSRKRRATDLSALPGSLGWEVWDQVVGQPMQLKLPQLKEAAKLLGLMVTGTKAELVLRLLTAFNLTTPAPGAPAQLLAALLQERSVGQHDFIFVDGPDRCSRLISYIHTLQRGGYESAAVASTAISGSGTGGMAAARAALAAGGFSSMADLAGPANATLEAEREKQRQAAEAAAAALAQRQAAAAAAWAERQAAVAAAWAQRQAAGAAPPATPPQVGPPGVLPTHGRCVCGNTPSPSCVRHCCRNCCSRVAASDGGAACPRHRF